MALVGRKGGIYAGNVPPTTARSRNRLSCRVVASGGPARLWQRKEAYLRKPEALGGLPHL